VNAYVAREKGEPAPAPTADKEFREVEKLAGLVKDQGGDSEKYLQWAIKAGETLIKVAAAG
jgi:hypothetical protein